MAADLQFQKPAYKIITPRLVLRCWQPEDAPRLRAAIGSSREHLLPWMPWAENEPTELQVKIERLRRWRGEFDLGIDFVYGIFSLDEKEVLGGCGLHTRVGADAREIGYWVRGDKIKQGIATETAAALTRVTFEIENLDRVEIHCDVKNSASAAIPKKLGFTQEGVLRQRRLGKPVRDLMLWTLLAAEYVESPAQCTAIEVVDVCGRKKVLGGFQAT